MENDTMSVQIEGKEAASPYDSKCVVHLPAAPAEQQVRELREYAQVHSRAYESANILNAIVYPAFVSLKQKIRGK